MTTVHRTIMNILYCLFIIYCFLPIALIRYRDSTRTPTAEWAAIRDIESRSGPFNLSTQMKMFVLVVLGSASARYHSEYVKSRDVVSYGIILAVKSIPAG